MTICKREDDKSGDGEAIPFEDSAKNPTIGSMKRSGAYLNG